MGSHANQLVRCHELGKKKLVLEIYALSYHSFGLRAEQCGFSSQQGKEAHVFFALSMLTPWPNQPPVLWILESFSPGARPLGREANHSLHLLPR
jgi:hypothetical protein